MEFMISESSAGDGGLPSSVRPIPFPKARQGLSPRGLFGASVATQRCVLGWGGAAAAGGGGLSNLGAESVIGVHTAHCSVVSLIDLQRGKNSPFYLRVALSGSLGTAYRRAGA